MAIALFIATGPNAGQQIPVGTGQMVRVGRTSRADYAFPNDTYLSGVHFEIGYNEGGCAIRDLGSSNGTFVNGTRLEQASVAVNDGDEITAGEMTFLVQVSSGEQPLAAPATVAAVAGASVVSPERTARMFTPGFESKALAQTALTGDQKRARDILMYQNAPLFAVVDAVRDQTLPQLLSMPSLRSQPLFASDLAGGGAGHAPILVELGQASSLSERADVHAFLEALLRAGWGKSWGIFLTSLSSLDDLAAHFHGFLLAHSGDERTLHLRLYDPRVLRAFLPTCEPAEIAAIFGPIVSYLIESDRPDTMLALSRGADGLITTRVSLAEQPMQAGAATQ
jgi:pSer/pThr/pTyr-binding forkhead associated (FHA) protein